MNWIKKVFGRSSHKIGENHGSYYDDRTWNQSSGGGISGFSNEEVDRAIALSLVDEDQRKRKEADRRSQLEEDEQLARTLQETLNAESPLHQNGQGSMPMPSSFPSSGYRICTGCNTFIGNGRFLSCMGAIWHPECFRCHACNRPIDEYEFSISGNHQYHKSCYKERHHPKCDVCKQFIPTNFFGQIEYRAHPFWNQKYCPSHEHDESPRCCSCERVEPRDAQYVSLEDGRNLCLECLDSSIMGTNECEPLLIEVLEFYEGLNMKIEQEIPLLLVERQALNEAREVEKNGHYYLPETRGLCLSEERTISTIQRRPKISNGRRAIDLMTEPFHLTRHCEVTAILILYGLPRLLTGSILAHEMMHAWLRLQGFANLSQQVEEGICQVLAYMWLESEIASSAGSNVESSSSSSWSSSYSHKRGKNRPRSHFAERLGMFFKNQIELDVSQAYGEGFRIGHRAVLKYGLCQTLNHIRVTGSFPP